MMTNTMTPKTDAGRLILAEIDAAYGSNVSAELRAAVVPFMVAMLNVKGATREDRDAAREQITGDAYDALDAYINGGCFEWIDAVLQNYTLAI